MSIEKKELLYHREQSEAKRTSIRSPLRDGGGVVCTVLTYREHIKLSLSMAWELFRNIWYSFPAKRVQTQLISICKSAKASCRWV